ncbi:RsmB/NOP family class I SAM-dependent RNA methyltransferase, partial [Enterocloster sp.]|uniref:RsmB/NOP family class I SAM-dependent RNA methyltransferase n=1 Tax=Enterocloster sp. TaxID=2719315 RepID=UPI0038908D13
MTDVKMLPKDFLAGMKELLGKEYDQYIKSYEEEWKPGLRVNTLKLSPEEFLEFSPWKLSPVPWTKNGFYYGSQNRPSRHPAYFAGLYYLQEPSAMTPAAMLPVEPGDKVLDVCAAPGGKSTELAAKLKGEGLLVSNDISYSRARALLKNLELTGAANIAVVSEDPEKLAEVWPEFFDKILVDAPCSGEGMFRRDDDMVKDWTSRGPEYYSPIQRRILEQTVAMLKPGGMLLYSTCTFSRLEDEDNVSFLLESHPEMELVPFNLASVPGSADGIGLNGCMRLFPHRMKGEGHFLALLRKKSEGSKKIPTPVGHPAKPGERHPNRAESRKIQGKKSSASEDTGLRELEAFLCSCRISW